MSRGEVLLIGVDGGATEVKAHAVACDDPARPTVFHLRPEAAARKYPRVGGFTPLPVAEQLAQRDAGRSELSAFEVKQGGLWIAAAAEAITEVAQQCAARRVLIGMGMPGLKTPDGRGIGVINNGPRMPAFLAELERLVAARGVELASPVAALGSDADYCGLGEEYAADGLFRGVQNAYYVGGGTGIADALKLRGQLVPFDVVKPWLMKSWQIPSALGPTFEKLVSASSLNRVWAELAGTEARRHKGTKDRADGCDCAARGTGTGATKPESFTAEPTYPEVAALAGDPRAMAWLDTAALVLAELIFERLWTIANGRPHAAHRGDAYLKLSPDHAYRGVLMDRVVIGQRVGLIYADARYRVVFADKLDNYLAAFIARAGDAVLASAYLVSRATPPRVASLKPALIRASQLRAAPALGAAVAAVRTGSARLT